MTKSKRGRYTLEFKQEAVRLVESGQSPASVARTLGVVEQTLGNWVKAHRAGSLQGVGGKAAGGPPFVFSKLTANLGAPSFASFAKGGNHEHVKPGGPALLFQNIKGHPGHQLLINQFGST